MHSELLVQRFVDQELSAAERLQLLVRLGQDAELRHRAIALEQLSLDASQLPRPSVPDAFVAAVLARTTPKPTLWTRVTAPLWAPRVLQWNLASAAAAAVMVLLVGRGLMMNLQRPSTNAPEVAAVPPVGAALPARVLVRLVVVQPSARTVQAAGDFNGWNPSRTPLEPTSNGAWTVTIPLEPGRYEYQFVVDGEQWIADPFAIEHSDDGFGSRNAVLDVRPAALSERSESKSPSEKSL
jgi:Glycogen recognition site of AMP-activated protein kinase